MNPEMRKGWVDQKLDSNIVKGGIGAEVVEVRLLLVRCRTEKVL